MASACDLKLSDRPSDVGLYGAQADACVAAPPLGFVFDDAVEAEVLDKVNAERWERGLPMLEARPELRAAARFHSLDMAVNRFFDHVGPDRRSHSDRISALDRTLIQSASRENLASFSGRRGIIRNSDAAAILHRQLMESPGHKANILAENIDHAAFGVVKTETGYWITQLFVRWEGDFSSPAPRTYRAGDTISIGAELANWDTRSFLLKGRQSVVFEQNAATDTYQVPDAMSGDYVLQVEGVRPTDDPLRYEIIRLPGPAVTLVPSR